jgi:NADH-quinone oxidoreductase subunit A
LKQALISIQSSEHWGARGEEHLTSLAANVITLWPLVVYFFAIIFVAATMIGLSYFLGQRHQERATGEPYESGIVSTGTARVRLSANFYLIAMFFVIFDLETVFIFAWAVSARETGWAGYAEILVFIVILLAALVYLWRLGALDWGTSKQRKARTLERKGEAAHELVAEQTR